MNDKPKYIGPTYQFPDGKIAPDDHGELSMLIGIHEGNVVIHFGTPVYWLGLPPKDAIEFARQVLEKAGEITEKKGE